MGGGQRLQRQKCQWSSFLSAGSIYNHLTGDEDEARYFKACIMLGVGSERAAFEVWIEE